MGEEFVQGTDFFAIPDFGGGIADMKMNDVSPDGAILVGTGNTKTGMKAFRADTTVLDEDGVPVPVQLTIQDLVTEQTLRSSSAQAVSADGTIIAGYGSTKTANRAFVTTFLDMMRLPEKRSGKLYPARARRRQVCRGLCHDRDRRRRHHRRPQRQPQGPRGLHLVRGTIPTHLKSSLGGQGTGRALQEEQGRRGHRHRLSPRIGGGRADRRGPQPDHPLPLGGLRLDRQPHAGWREDEYIGYFYDLEYILIKTGAGEASLMGSSWILYEATGISAAGDRIVGWGINPEGGVEAWLVTNFPYDELVFTHE